MLAHAPALTLAIGAVVALGIIVVIVMLAWPRKPIHDPTHPGRRQRPQRQAREQRNSTDRGHPGPRSLESLAVAHARRTHGLAAPAAEAGIEVLPGRRIIRWNLISFQRAHEHDPAAWTVRLVSGDRVGWACRQAESAVYAGIERCQIQSHESLPSSATERHPRGSNVSRKRPTSCPTPSRYAPK